MLRHKLLSTEVISMQEAPSGDGCARPPQSKAYKCALGDEFGHALPLRNPSISDTLTPHSLCSLNPQQTKCVTSCRLYPRSCS